MNGNNGAEELETAAFEIGVVVPKSSGNNKDEDETIDCVEVLVDEFRKAGLIVDRVVGLQNEFIRVRYDFLLLNSAVIYYG